MSPESTFDYIAQVSFNMHIQGQPDDSAEYGGVTIDRNILPLWEKVKTLPRFPFPKRIEDMGPAEIHAQVENCAQELLKGSVGVRTTGTFFDSWNPVGGPPWLRTTTGGALLLEINKEVDDSGRKEWTRRWTTKVGVSVCYYMEVQFEAAN